MTPLYYAVRLVKNAPRVGVCLEYGIPNDPVTHEPLDRSPRWQCWINGESVSGDTVILEMDGVTKMPIVNGEKITHQEYAYLLDVARWAAAHAPDSPEANPRKPIDLNTAPTIF